ncbi:MAG: 16S rRNA (cytosine(1402)-N(4))-methyltransferase RsmH [Bacillota bacterium]
MQSGGALTQTQEHNSFHRPVMLAEVLAALCLRPGGVYVDCTVGGGGHAREILRLTDPDGVLIGLDRDPLAVRQAEAHLAEYGGRARLFNENFVNLPRVLEDLQIREVDGLLYDLGVSSAQLDDPERGFSYMADGPLDMRMDPAGPVSAKDLVNRLPADELADIFRRYGEERWAERIAVLIAAERKRRPIETTGRLAEIIKRAIPARARRSGPHPAKRSFQALRIAVNQELDVLAGSLKEAVAYLKAGGRICVLSFHSLEDRIVKATFQELSARCKCPPDLPACVCGRKGSLKIITRRPLTPQPAEVECNPRARSARLRVAEKLPAVLKKGEGE